MQITSKLLKLETNIVSDIQKWSIIYVLIYWSTQSK